MCFWYDIDKNNRIIYYIKIDKVLCIVEMKRMAKCPMHVLELFRNSFSDLKSLCRKVFADFLYAHKSNSFNRHSSIACYNILLYLIY